MDDDAVDPLVLPLQACQYPQDTDEAKRLPTGDAEEETLADVVTKRVFGMQEPPRWVLVASFGQLVLIDRGKWNEKRLLRFDLAEILGRRERSTLEATAALLHREHTCPEDGIALLDTLDENAHKHAFAVSEDLKYALREAIELLGNEAVHYLRTTRRKGVYSGEEALDDKPEELTEECLRYMYRLLFLFYIEARPELGYAPMNADAYRMGYSLETLRELELVKLTTDEARNGHFFDDSIRLLFDLVFEGFPKRQAAGEGTQTNLLDLPQGPGGDGASGDGADVAPAPAHHTFRIAPLKSHLFDPAKTPTLNKVRFRNHVLQRVIELMSLSNPKKSGRKKARRGRISYAQLGINQLGAVYEALLSYSGFFAKTDLYEVKKAKDDYNELENAYFVRAEDLEKYTEKEKVYNPDGSLKKYEKGAFIYRLAGRNREKSASYYTPEVLTKCVVKYALKELLPGKTADEILRLTVCEPAMGSGAFLNEAVNQLAEAYLRAKQDETGEPIAHDEYAQELQRVKMFIADNNVFGVDLNPVAVELAEVSLWLNTIHEGAFVPWFGMQLVTGNSLVGARRQVFNSLHLRKRGKKDPLWLDEVPERVAPGETRREGTVYHFLLPDAGMAAYNDKVVKGLAPDEMKAMKDWRKDFTKPFAERDVKKLERLSAAVDKLWKRHAEQLRDIRRRTSDPLPIYGQPRPENLRPPTTTQWKDRVYFQELHSEGVRNSSPYRRLKLVMDYWCALWFWPIEEADLLPSRDDVLLDLSLLLEGDVLRDGGGGERAARDVPRHAAEADGARARGRVRVRGRGQAVPRDPAPEARAGAGRALPVPALGAGVRRPLRRARRVRPRAGEPAVGARFSGTRAG